ncbi:hypothetical protein ANO11243_054110 [Dothideomycetidae sp. 11243]|nr:hypothetical protein ANO11243_054110 [fungal sp. No.11243]
MPLYLSLIAYVTTGRARRHWIIFVTTHPDSVQGTKYHAIGSPFIGYRTEVVRYNRGGTRRRYSLHYLGQMEDIWADALESIALAIPALGVNSRPLEMVDKSGVDATAVELL